MREARGVILLETLAALTIFGFAGVTALVLANQARASQRQTFAAEDRLTDESRLLSAYQMLAHADLDGRLGDTRVGPYLVRVARRSAGLYVVLLGDSSAWDIETFIYRPGANAP